MTEQDEQSQSGRVKVRVGDSAPDFTLPDQSGERVNLYDWFGKMDIVLYFYPRDHTAICTEQACAFRDSYEAFLKAGAAIIAVSSDSVESHAQFAQKHHLPFTLLSDEGGVVRKRYGVPTSFGLPGRVTYIIDRCGIVRHIFFSQFTSKKHVEQALAVLRAISSERV